MKNGIRYAISPSSNSIKKGRHQLAINNVGYGATFETGFFNTISPPDGGYTIYTRKNTIVESGLILCFDIGNNASSPYCFGAGLENAVYDISGNSKILTLNNITFETGTYSMVFNGSNGYASGPPCNTIPISNYFTIECWFNTNFQHGPINGATAGRIVNIHSGSPGTTIGIMVGSEGLGFYNSGTSWQNDGVPVNTGLWTHSVLVYNNGNIKLYRNTQLVINQSGGSISLSSYPLIIGSYDGTSIFFNGKVSSINIYDRCLSEAEILQNFNETVSVYGNIWEYLDVNIDNISNVTCNSGDDGIIYLSINGGTTPYIISMYYSGSYYQTNIIFSTSSTSISIGSIFNVNHALKAGTYHTIISDYDGAGWSNDIVVNEPDPIVITLDSATPFVDGFATIYITVTGGTPPYFYTWNDSTFTTTISTDEDPTVAFVDDGGNGIIASYYLLVTDSNVCNQFAEIIYTIATGTWSQSY